MYTDSLGAVLGEVEAQHLSGYWRGEAAPIVAGELITAEDVSDLIDLRLAEILGDASDRFILPVDARLALDDFWLCSRCVLVKSVTTLQTPMVGLVAPLSMQPRGQH